MEYEKESVCFCYGGVEMITNFKFRDLTPGDVEVRVAMCRANGLSLLIYKDARVDQQILDETVGQLNWKKSYREVKGNLYCTIEIWDSDKSTWIAKEDCGVESNTEKEKGEASDAQKRAGFAWGIGRELYSAPFIWVSSKDCTIEERSKGVFACKDHFSVSAMKIENKKITDLQIINDNTGAVVYQMKNARAAASQSSGRKAESVKKAEPASVEQVQTKAKKGNLTLDQALDHKLPNKTGDMLSLKEYISVCKTTEQRDRMMKFLAEKVKERSEHSEACLIVHRALQSHEISFS